jgi:lysophospholipase L1-like esterase
MFQNRSRQPETSLRQKLLLILFGIFLCLALLETGLRLAGLGYCFMNPLPKDRGAKYRILCVGESTTVGIGASNPALFNYPIQLESMLRKKFPRLQAQCFFNYGIGFNTTENLIDFPELIEKQKPQLVIFMVGVNNCSNFNKSNILIFNKHKGLSRFILEAVVFMDQFQAWKLLKTIAYNAGLLRRNTPKTWKESKNDSTLINKKYGNDIFYCNGPEVAFYDLREMAKICRKRRIKVIICGYPSLNEESELSIAQKRVASLFGVPFLDNHAVFKNLPDPGSYFSDDLHPNDKGYRVLADNIFNCILENHLIESA